MGSDHIADAWLVFVNKIISGEIKPAKILKYFFSKNNDSFDVIGSMSDYHNTNYILTRSKK